MLSLMCTCFPVAAHYFYLAFSLQLSHTHDHIDLILLHQELYALAHLVGYTTAALDNSSKVGRERINLHPVVLRMAQIFKDISALNECFRRYTSPIETYAAKAFLFYYSSLIA